MNKELKIYIKENLKKYKKRKSIVKTLLFPITFLFSFFSEKFKSISFEDYEEDFDDSLDDEIDEEYYEEQSRTYSSLKKIYDDEEFSETAKHNSKSKEEAFFEDDIPTFLRNKKDINIQEYIDENNKYNDFQTLLFKMIDERNLIDSDVYNKVHIDRRLFSKIRNDKEYHPSKETIILLGLSMELSEMEIEKLLDSASYSLPRNNHYDLIIRFCFMKGIYKITEVNNLLDQYNCKLFNY